MKKFILITCLLIVSFTKGFAFSDLQVGVGTMGMSLDNFTFTDIVLENHNYFDENGTYGICEAITFSPYTFENAFYPNNYCFSAFVGPVIRFAASNINEFTMAFGFRYYLDYRNKTDVYPTLSEVIKIRDDIFYSTYSLSTEFQWRLNLTDTIGLVTGFPLSFGVGRQLFNQQVTSTNPESKYRKMSEYSDYERTFYYGPLYILFSVKF